MRSINHPGQITAQDLEALEEVVENFPYCQLAHVLIAKGSHDQLSMLAPQKLRKAAAYALSRDRLKKLILDRSEAGGAQQSLSAEVVPPTEAKTIVEPAQEEFPFIFEVPKSHEDQLLSELAVTASSPASLDDDDLKALERQRQLELIENFIKTAPRIPAPRSDENTFPDKDLSEKSSALSNKLISESLAKIMVKQGKVEKAIEIYQELICKYPEKKAYFAGKIDELNLNSRAAE